MFTALVAALLLVPPDQDRPDCATWAECREEALAARSSGEHERFHDLAWRAVQKGKANDPELMLLLARAQSLSGRPHDALVMLQRLAGLGVRAGAAATDDDFRRVRALDGWAVLERRWASSPEAVAAPPEARKAAPAPGTPDAPAKPDGLPEAALARGAETLRFEAPALTASGLTYDGVSRRFIVGDRTGRRLSVVDEFSHGVTTLASARGAGFGDVTGVAIDGRDGTLWVVSHGDGGSRLHKLQLVSARVLAAIDPPTPEGGARFADVAVGAQGTVLVLDAGERQLLRLTQGEGVLGVASRLGEREGLSVAAATAGIAYVSHRDGLVRVNLASGEASDVTAPEQVALGGLERLRWHQGALLAIQRQNGRARAIRLRLAPGGRVVTALDVLDDDLGTGHSSALTTTADTLYYLAQADGFAVIREVPLRRN